MQRITTLDLHTEGEPLRIITSGIDLPPGDNIIARRAFAQAHLDGMRRSLMFEPRGHADMYGALPMPPSTHDGDLGVLFMHNEGWSSMCGHGIIALTTALAAGMLQLPYLPAQTGTSRQYKIDAPAGRILATAHMDGDQVTCVSFENVASFALALDQSISVLGLGEIHYDIGYGGAFYAYVDLAKQPALGHLHITPAHNLALIDVAMRIKRAVMATRPLPHPFSPELSFLYGTILHRDSDASPGAHSRNVCVFAEGEVDRSPTGTGVSGRIALEHARGRLDEGAAMTIESILATPFTACVLRETHFGPHRAIIPQVSGRAWLTGRHEFLIDPRDPLREGFLLR